VVTSGNFSAVTNVGVAENGESLRDESDDDASLRVYSSWLFDNHGWIRFGVILNSCDSSGFIERIPTPRLV
jgi:hypothetical protein